MSLRTLENNYRPPQRDHAGAVQRVSHQFEDIDQQNESYVVGMWTFLVTEIMFFGALFLAYSVYRVLYFQTYLDAHRFLSIFWGTTNTLILLTSSLTMALAVYCAQKGNRTGLIALLTATVLLSFGFLGVKSIEYSSKFHEGLFPGAHFDYAKANRMYAEEHGGEGGHGAPAENQRGEAAGEGSGNETAAETTAAFNNQPGTGFNPLAANADSSIAIAEESASAVREEARGRRAQLFFSLYFTMTGLHAIHIILGIIMMSLIAFLSLVRHNAVQDYMPTEMVGLYWHFVDIVWIFLFPLMYLIS